MSKAALNCGGATMARDLKEDGIAVGLIHPGAVSRPSLPTASVLEKRQECGFSWP